MKYRTLFSNQIRWKPGIPSPKGRRKSVCRLFRVSDGTIYATRCDYCGGFWRVYQNEHHDIFDCPMWASDALSAIAKRQNELTKPEASLLKVVHFAKICRIAPSLARQYLEAKNWDFYPALCCWRNDYLGIN